MVSCRASKQGLAIVESKRTRKGWNRQAEAWCQQALVSRATLKRFWQGNPIREEYFIAICQAVGLEQWAEIIDREIDSNLHIDWEEPTDISTFYGRTKELATLEKWILKDGCRVVTLVGMGGIGKTTLAAKLWATIKEQEKFEYAIQRSLRHAPPVTELLADLIQFFSNGKETQVSANITDAVAQLIEYLKSHRCLLVLDDVEMVLSYGELAGKYREGYEGYGVLIRQVGAENHQSHLLLTSREILREAASLELRNFPAKTLRLEGLSDTDAENILVKKGLFDPENWHRLIKIYSGNPAALQIVADAIQCLFKGKVSEYLELNTVILGDISDLLENQFDRLSALETKIMYSLAIARQPTLFSELRESLFCAASQSEMLEAIESLERRSLIEKDASEVNEVLFTQQPVVMKYVTRRFAESVSEELQKLLLTADIEAINLLKSHPIFTAQALAEVTEVQIRLIVTPIKEKLITSFHTKSKIIEQINRAIAILPKDSFLEKGYAVLNLEYILSVL